MAREFANVETNLFPALARRFQETGALTPFELWAILKWKANRASTFHLNRLGTGQAFVNKTGELAEKLHRANSDKDRMAILMEEPFRFRLSTASAILTVLYPDRFIVYDFRVCDQLGGFEELKHRRFSDGLWAAYCRYCLDAQRKAPDGLTMRQIDQHHWGKSWLEEAKDALSLWE